MIKGVTHTHLGSIWYHSEPSDVPYSPNQFLGWDFFATFYSKTALVIVKKLATKWEMPRLNNRCLGHLKNLGLSFNLVEDLL